MARCGCNGATAGTTCEAVMECVAANTDFGLRVVDGRLQVWPSADAGNAVTFGPDGGLYADPGNLGPGDIQWEWTVATLPEQVMAGTEGSQINGVPTDPRIIEYNVAHGIEVYSTAVFSLQDGVAWETLSTAGIRISRFSDNPSNMPLGRLDSLVLPFVQYDSGTRVNATGRDTGAPPALLTPDGGWAGFYAHPFGARTVSELLRIIRGRMVVDLRCTRRRSVADSVRDVESMVRAVVAAGAQEWVIIQPNIQDDTGARIPLAAVIDPILEAGIAAGVNLFREDEIDVPYEPAELVAAGVEWVALAGPDRGVGMTEARISDFVSAGLEVQVHIGGRQYWAQQMFDLGCRMVASPDPVYTNGVFDTPATRSYRTDHLPGLVTRTTVNGALTPLTDLSPAVYRAGFARQDEPGRWFPEFYGWPDASTPVVYNNQLLGQICPTTRTTDYRLRLRITRTTTGSTVSSQQWMGVFFAAPTDRDISPLANANRNGYNCVVYPNPQVGEVRLGIYRHTNGGSTALAESTTGTSLFNFGQWTDLTVTLSGNDISFTATRGAVTQTLNATDTTHRGRYAFVNWRDANNPSVAFMRAYDNPVDLGMYELL